MVLTLPDLDGGPPQNATLTPRRPGRSRQEYDLELLSDDDSGSDADDQVSDLGIVDEIVQVPVKKKTRKKAKLKKVAKAKQKKVATTAPVTSPTTTASTSCATPTDTRSQKMVYTQAARVLLDMRGHKYHHNNVFFTFTGDPDKLTGGEMMNKMEEAFEEAMLFQFEACKCCVAQTAYEFREAGKVYSRLSPELVPFLEWEKCDTPKYLKRVLKGMKCFFCAFSVVIFVYL